ncbi:hypothetical protein VCRA2110O2_30369 [Vibrio crassostreae]|nr:hypothetical protein VCHA44O286_50009 [Vibrio chagasii]CAK2879031.1 hypothetical protein VCRA2110O2_30369 [Vibrio crassostreae]
MLNKKNLLCVFVRKKAICLTVARAANSIMRDLLEANFREESDFSLVYGLKKIQEKCTRQMSLV